MSNYYPIIYVRGYAMTDSEMLDTVATPYMGFNLGSTKVRQSWDRKIVRHIFESPLVRLMKDYGYQDIFSDGKELQANIPERPVVIYRYYESEWFKQHGMAAKDKESATRKEMEYFAKGLASLILDLRKEYCSTHGMNTKDFKVYLVAHSMGGLICRCLLQNKAFKSSQARGMVDKVFTYGTPHNGIDMAGINVPGFIGFNNINNFNVKKMRKYLSIEEGSIEHANMLENKFPEDRFFSLVGTDSKDYSVAAGMSRRLTGEFGDGLVRIENAYVHGAPKAHVHRSHSGDYGIVNSEEGYQNLTRFLFGDLRVDAQLNVQHLPLSSEIKNLLKENKKVRGSYYFESALGTRGADYFLDERSVGHESAILREFDVMFPKSGKKPRMPKLFTAFMDSSQCAEAKAGLPKNQWRIVFTVDIAVKPTDFKVDNLIFRDRALPNPQLFSNQLVIEAFLDDNDGASAVSHIKASWTNHSINWEPDSGERFPANSEGVFVIPTPIQGAANGEDSFSGEVILRFRGA